MYDEKTPIYFSCPPEYENVELYSIHDVHYGNECFQQSKWDKLRKEILSEPNRYCVIVGDMMENAIPNSKSDIFTQTATPMVQQQWVTEQFSNLADRIVAIIPGNHENNRSTKICGLYPLYDCALIAGVQDKYRQNFAFLDIGVGHGYHEKNRQIRYAGYLVHKARDNKNFNSADCIDGIDFAFYGHDNDPKDHPRAKLVYDPRNKSVSVKNVEVINNGAFLDYGGYASTSGYRPVASKMYKLILDGKHKSIQTVGFYL